jgi:ribosome recycling factor
MLFDQEELDLELAMIFDDFDRALKELRTGKVNITTINSVEVEAYGVKNKLYSLAQVAPDGPLSVVVKPHNKADTKNIVSALQLKNLGGSVEDKGDHIRMNFQPLTTEDRKKTASLIGDMLESARVKARRVRQEYMQKVKSLDKVSEDDQKFSEEKIQKTIDESIKDLEGIAELKEKEILEINK